MIRTSIGSPLSYRRTQAAPARRGQCRTPRRPAVLRLAREVAATPRRCAELARSLTRLRYAGRGCTSTHLAYSDGRRRQTMLFASSAPAVIANLATTQDGRRAHRSSASGVRRTPDALVTSADSAANPWCAPRCAPIRAYAASVTRPTRSVEPNPPSGAARFAPGRNRTYDLALRRRALYPLSYGRGGRISLARVEVTARVVDVASCRDVHDLARVAGRGRRRSGRGASRRHERLRRGGADRALRRVGGVGARVRRGERRRARRRPVCARRDLRPAAARAVRRAQRDRRRAARPPGQAARPARPPAARPAARRAADVVDDLARRSRRHGAPRGEDDARRALPPPEAEARRRATGSTSSASAPFAA